MHQPPTDIAGARMARLLAVLATVALLFTAVPASAQTPPDVTPARVEGETRYETAANIATLTFSSASVAHLVTGENYPDAVAASFAAGSTNGPILLTGRDAVPQATLDALRQLGVNSVVLVGGESAISDDVRRSLDQAGYRTERIRGDNRYDTSAAVATRYGQERVGTAAGQRAAFLATGASFTDALAAGPIAARERFPLLLTPPDSTVPSVTEALRQLGIEKIFLLGGRQAISEDVESFYRSQGYDVERLGGPSKMDTAWLIADMAVQDFGFTHELVLLGRGDAYPDALAASIHGAQRGAPLVITDTSTVLSDDTRQWFSRTCPRIRVIRALGGRDAVSVPVLNEAEAAAEACPGTS